MRWNVTSYFVYWASYVSLGTKFRQTGLTRTMRDRELDLCVIGWLMPVLDFIVHLHMSCEQHCYASHNDLIFWAWVYKICKDLEGVQKYRLYLKMWQYSYIMTSKFWHKCKSGKFYLDNTRGVPLTVCGEFIFMSRFILWSVIQEVASTVEISAKSVKMCFSEWYSC